MESSTSPLSIGPVELSKTEKGTVVSLYAPHLFLIALIGLGPAGGYGAWAWATNARVTKIETREETILDENRDMLKAITKHSETLPVLLTQQAEIQRRLDRMEEKMEDRNKP